MNWKPGMPDGVETEMVGAASVAQSDRCYADVLEWLHPLLEDRGDGGILLQVDSANLSAAVVHVEISRDFFLLGLHLIGPESCASTRRSSI